MCHPNPKLISKERGTWKEMYLLSAQKNCEASSDNIIKGENEVGWNAVLGGFVEIESISLEGHKSKKHRSWVKLSDKIQDAQ